MHIVCVECTASGTNMVLSVNADPAQLLASFDIVVTHLANLPAHNRIPFSQTVGPYVASPFFWVLLDREMLE